VKFKREASALKKQVMRQLWDDEGKFFKVMQYHKGAKAKGANNTLVEVRELHGYTPW
jgi:hypothetical protein